jgi:hypothetical protein
MSSGTKTSAVYNVATSPLSNRIFTGRLIKSGRMWAAGKTDVTVSALVAVAEHVIKFGEPVILSEASGVPIYKITVEDLKLCGGAL